MRLICWKVISGDVLLAALSFSKALISHLSLTLFHLPTNIQQWICGLVPPLAKQF